MKAQYGDTIDVEQRDGLTIQILVSHDGVAVKTNEAGATIQVRRDSSFLVACRAVPEAGAKP